MKKLLPILLVLCTVAFAQNAKSKFVVSISGELDVKTSDALADIINHAVIKSQLYSVLPNDRQFRETLKKEWKKGNVSDDRVISLAKNAGADYLCFAKITSLLGSNQIAIQLVNLKSDPMEYSDMGIARGKLNDLDVFAEKIEEAVDDMLGTAKSNSAGGNSKFFTDSRDGKQYKIVTIGKQTWMAENMNYDAFKSKCYDNNSVNCDKYGRLYNWHTAKMLACPEGWHLPSNMEWDKLYRFADGTKGTESPYNSKTAGKFLKATSGWKNNGNGDDKYGFSALPGGGGDSEGNFGGVGTDGNWWGSDGDYGAGRRGMSYYGEYTQYDNGDKSILYSVRCVKD